MINNIPTLITFAIYLILMFAIGYLGFRSTNNLSDYILGGRRLGSFVTALSAGASDMSGWLLMGLPGAIYLSGLSEMWIAIGLIVGAWLNWLIVAGRLRVYTEKCSNALTLPEYLSARFEDKSNLIRMITAIVILIFFTIYCASGVVAGARLFENMFGLSYTTALFIGALATISYVLIGGFLAVSWTDTVQASLMITGLVMVPIMVILNNGGISASINHIYDLNPLYLNMGNHLNSIAIISLLAWGLGYFGQPHILVRFMAASSAKAIPNARRIGMTWMILCLAGAVSIGFFGISYYAHHPEFAKAVTENPETVFMELTKNLFTPWIAGVFLAAILAAIMSTLSCQLLVCSSALTEDIYKTFLHKEASQKELVWFGRAMVLAVSIVAMILASNPQNKVLGMVSYAWAGFGAAFGPVILISLLWKNMTKAGAIAGIIAGATTVLVWKQFSWFQLYEIVPGFILATLAILIVSKIGKPASSSMQRTFKEVEAAIKSGK